MNAVSSATSFSNLENADKALSVRFDLDIQDGKEVEIVYISIPGDNTLLICDVVTDYHRQRFAEAYAYFKSSDHSIGTPLSLLPGMQDTLERDLRAKNFDYIEQLARANDQALLGVIGGIGLRRRAQVFLQERAAQEQESKNKQMFELLEKQFEQIKELESKVQELSAAKRPGRPPNTMD